MESCSGRLAEASSQIGWEDDTGLGRLRREPQRTDDPADTDRSIDVAEPQGQLLVLLAHQRLLEVVGHGACRQIASNAGILAGGDHAAQVAQIEVFHLTLCGLGAVEPFGDAQLGEHVLGHLDNRLLGHDGLAGGFELRVLFLHAGTNCRHALQRHLGDRALLLGEIGEHRVAAGFAGTQALRLRALRQLGRSLEMGALAPLVGATGTVTVTATITATITASAVTCTVTTTITTTTVTLGVTTTPSVTAVTAVSTLAAVTLGTRFDHRFERLLAREELEHVGVLGLFARRDHRLHLDAVEHLLDLHLQHVTDGRSGWQQGGIHLPVGLAGASGAPRPRAVGERARQLDFNPAGHLRQRYRFAAGELQRVCP